MDQITYFKFKFIFKCLHQLNFRFLIIIKTSYIQQKLITNKKKENERIQLNIKYLLPSQNIKVHAF